MVGEEGIIELEMALIFLFFPRFTTDSPIWPLDSLIWPLIPRIRIIGTFGQDPPNLDHYTLVLDSPKFHSESLKLSASNHHITRCGPENHPTL